MFSFSFSKLWLVAFAWCILFNLCQGVCCVHAAGSNSQNNNNNDDYTTPYSRDRNSYFPSCFLACSQLSKGEREIIIAIKIWETKSTSWVTWVDIRPACRLSTCSPASRGCSDVCCECASGHTQFKQNLLCSTITSTNIKRIRTFTHWKVFFYRWERRKRFWFSSSHYHMKLSPQELITQIIVHLASNSISCEVLYNKMWASNRKLSFYTFCNFCFHLTKIGSLRKGICKLWWQTSKLQKTTQKHFL